VRRPETSGLFLFQRVPAVLADQALAFQEWRTRAGSSSTRLVSFNTPSTFCMPATAPCSAALAYSASAATPIGAGCKVCDRVGCS